LTGVDDGVGAGIHVDVLVDDDDEMDGVVGRIPRDASLEEVEG
jgi:hypothetical protein